LPAVPVLLLARELDLSMSFESCAQRGDPMRGRLVILKTAGRSLQFQGDPATLEAVRGVASSG
jgi:hypothetical protein